MVTGASGRAQIAADFQVCGGAASLATPLDLMNFFSNVASNFDGAPLVCVCVCMYACVYVKCAPSQARAHSLSHTLAGIVQYNKDNRAFEGGVPPPTMDDACAIVTGGPDVYKQYVAFNTCVTLLFA